MEDNGNLVLYDTNDQPMWKCCDYNGGGTAPYTITMRDDGNLIITDNNNNTRWQSKDFYQK
jgi:DNA-binding beta-propeller fold protein YncE